MNEQSTFRPDLEGLRAVAVVLVLLYHAQLPGMSGGYVGVDVFFVLSGFLITGLLLRELTATGRVDFPRFYARRARRLLPAAAATLVVTVVASAIMLPAVRMPDVTADVISAGLYVSNIRFALQATDYLASALPPSPVLHFWSLSLEEQFYLFWPALLALASGAAFASGRLSSGLRRVTITLAVVLVVSFAASVWLTQTALPWAFFSLPTRAWELALGGLLALPAARRVPGRVAPWLGWAGLAMIVASAIVMDDATVFPGTAVLLPTLGAALVIAAGLTRTPAAVRPAGVPAPGILLGLAAPRFLGRISYSLYLWHWPILVLPVAALGTDLRLSVRLALAAAAIGVAVLSQRYIEAPFRHGGGVRLGVRRSLALAATVSVVVVATSLVAGAAAMTRLDTAGPAVGGPVTDVVLGAGGPDASPARPSSAPGATPGASAPGASVPGTSTPGASLPALAPEPVPADLTPTLADVRGDLPITYADGCHLEQDATTSGACVYGDAGSATTVVLFGDSHAAQWFPALLRLAEEHDWRLVALTKSRCTPAQVTVWHPTEKRPYVECDTWRDRALSRIAAEKPALVVTSFSRAFKFMLDGKPVALDQHRDALMEDLRVTLAQLHEDSAVALIGDTPRPVADPSSCLSQHLTNASACAVPYSEAVDQRLAAAMAKVAGETGATWIDPASWVCRSDPCPAVFGRFLIYRDAGHLTATYARALAKELDAALPPIGP